MFGLNALGGAVNLQMKNGFTYQGFEGRAPGRLLRPDRRLGCSTACARAMSALYIAAEGVKDNGWRYQSPSQIGALLWRFRLAQRRHRDSSVVGAAADNYFGVVGPTPVEMLTRDWRSIYTWPQTTQNQAQLLSLNGS